VCEEIDFLNTLGGESYIVDGLGTNAATGVQKSELDARRE